MNWRRLLPPPFRHRNGAPGKPLIDGEYVARRIENSPVPVILTLVLVWMTAAVLLTLSDSRQRDLTVWADGQEAPFSVRARCDFDYMDSGATEAAREAARRRAPRIYRIVPEKQAAAERAVNGFQLALQLRSDAEKSRRAYSPGENPGAKLVASMIEFAPVLAAERRARAKWDEVLDLRHGIAGATVKLPPEKHPTLVLTADGERSYPLRPSTPREAAFKLADELKLDGAARREFVRCLEKLLESGTLAEDAAATAKARDDAAAAVRPLIRTRKQGDLLVERQRPIDRLTVDMLKAERAALPRGFGMAALYSRMGLSLLVMAAALFFLYRTYPQLFGSTRRIALSGAVIVISLLANYGALQLFFHLFRSGIVPKYDLVLFMMPIPLGAALMSVLLGNRTALFSGFLVAAVTALMILPDRSFELALRWFAISALMTLIIRDVRNYRSFFVRVFFGGAALTAAVNCDILLFPPADIRVWKVAGVAVAADTFACAIADLLLVFAFELVCNTDTSMSLMVLCDYSHPLLEKLKREAPGTMFHSMTVATLAEDAARAIKANPLRAKAGALFHDIGKLSMPQYFVENNVDSPKDHAAMPPQRSCGIIRGHVKEGLALAKSYRLCRFIRDAIATHHGDDLISFFYRKALEQGKDAPGGPAVLESQFRYDGAPPEGKELTIIALADACEAASRSLNKPAPAQIENLVNEIFLGRLRGGQLRNSRLTLEELNKVRECFIADLISFNHGRIAYQQEKTNDPTALPVAKSPAAGAEKK